MSAKSTHPDPFQFAGFLRNGLSAKEHAVIDQHVSACDTCQMRLEQTAAESEWWTDAQSFLSDDMIDHELEEIESQAESNPTRPRTDVRTIVAWLDPTDDPRMLGRLAGYEIAGVIGSGGMGVVLKGLDTALNRYVAIKVLAPHLATSGAARQRFAREAQAAAAVVHDNVIAIHGVSEANDLPYLVMPYIRGISLQRRIDDNGALTVSEVLRIGMQTAAGLAAAHAQGLVHRDIKPANILLDGTTERVLLTDFGLARAADDASVTHSGVIAGTPHYMSPEQAQGEGIDHRSDLFSLGSVLFAISTGRPPFRAETNWAVLKRVGECDCPLATDVNPQVPIWLSNIIARLHQQSPDARIQTSVEVHDVLAECLAHIQQPTRHSLPTAYTTSLRQNGFRRTINWALAIAVAVAVSYGIFYFATTDATTASPQTAAATNANDPSTQDSPTNDFQPPAPTDSIEFAWDDGTDELLRSIDESIQNLERD